MFFLDTNPTRFDLRWTMFGIPVRVHPMFWLVGLILGGDAILRQGLEYMLLWIVCVFVSVLIHELGHALTGLMFGSPGSIVLYGFGGLAIGASALRKRWQRVLVYFAGPFAGFLFLGLALGVTVAIGISTRTEGLSPLVTATISYLFFINFFWGIVNLMPVWPLDGGQVSREFFDWIMPRSGILVSLGISMVVAILIAIASFMLLGSIFMPLFFGMMALNSFQAMRQVQQQSSWDDDRTGWERQPRDTWDRDRDRW